MVASAINILVQMGAMAFHQGPFALTVATFAGTLSGLVPKHVLDKVWVLYDRSASPVRDLRQIVLYTLLSGATTLMFWAFEPAFHWLDGGEATLRYLGAALGLGLGYWSKYHFDRRFVFQCP